MSETLMRTINDKELIQRIAEHNDEQAFKALFVDRYAYLLSFATSILQVKPLAEEVVSDVFISIWENRAQLISIDNISLYLYVSVRNRSLNALEKLKRERTIWIEETNVEFRGFVVDPMHTMISAENMNEIKKAITSLPPKCQLIFKLVKEDGLSYKEAAELLELSVKTIENQMGIALKKLAEALPAGQFRYSGK